MNLFFSQWSRWIFQVPSFLRLPSCSSFTASFICCSKSSTTCVCVFVGRAVGVQGKSGCRKRALALVFLVHGVLHLLLEVLNNLCVTIAYH